MQQLDIVTAPDKKLKTISKEVTTFDDKLSLLLEAMLITMYESHGIGLAAPQVGKNIRLFVMDCEPNEDDSGNLSPNKPFKIINPVITRYSDSLISMEEGCLSLPDIRIPVDRPENITLEYVNEHGVAQSLEAGGLMARCIQHELDHLDGKTLLDHIGPVRRQLLLKKLTKHKKAS